MPFLKKNCFKFQNDEVSLLSFTRLDLLDLALKEMIGNKKLNSQMMYRNDEINRPKCIIKLNLLKLQHAANEHYHRNSCIC